MQHQPKACSSDLGDYQSRYLSLKTNIYVGIDVLFEKKTFSKYSKDGLTVCSVYRYKSISEPQNLPQVYEIATQCT